MVVTIAKSLVVIALTKVRDDSFKDHAECLDLIISVVRTSSPVGLTDLICLLIREMKSYDWN